MAPEQKYTIFYTSKNRPELYKSLEAEETGDDSVDTRQAVPAEPGASWSVNTERVQGFEGSRVQGEEKIF